MPPKKLDSGGQGQIYEVDKDTVYKVIKFSDYYKEISELAILHSLNHPCMIKMKKWELNRNECKIYMERMHMNMYDFAKKNTFEKRLEIFPNLLWSMVRVARFFQRNGIMNCDIKTENVMISKDGRTIKIIDFGHIISDEDYPIIGTRSYQPPELWLDDKYYANKSMVWSIGITALEFLYRIHPIVDIIYGEDSESDYESDSRSRPSMSGSGSGSGSGSYTVSSDESDEYRQKYVNLFEILMEEGDSLAFRHRLEQPDASIQDKMRVINTIIERMLTYDSVKRISLDELYHHRIFNNIRGSVQEEPIVTKKYDTLYCDKELTPIFLNVGRKLYREEIMVQSYTLLSLYMEKQKQRPSRREFFITSMACMDIMSYTFSMVPSSRDLFRKVILGMRKVDEHQIFERVIEIAKSVQFNLFYNGILDVITHQDKNVFYSLLLEIIELETENGKKAIHVKHLLDSYFSSNVLNDEDYDDDVKMDAEDPPDVIVQSQPQPPIQKQAFVPKVGQIVPDKVAETEAPEKLRGKRGSYKKDDKEITEHDIDQTFLQKFKEHIRSVYHQELLKKREEEERGDVLYIEL